MPNAIQRASERWGKVELIECDGPIDPWTRYILEVSSATFRFWTSMKEWRL